MTPMLAGQQFAGVLRPCGRVRPDAAAASTAEMVLVGLACGVSGFSEPLGHRHLALAADLEEEVLKLRASIALVGVEIRHRLAELAGTAEKLLAQRQHPQVWPGLVAHSQD